MNRTTPSTYTFSRKNHKMDCLRLLFCLAAVSSLVIAGFMGYFAYRHFFGCPGKLVSFKAVSSNAEDELWAYAGFWSMAPSKGQFVDTNRLTVKFAPAPVLENLERTFEQLSIKPLDQLPRACKRKIPNPTALYENSQDQNQPCEVMHFFDDSANFIDPIFSADLKTEFRFKENIMASAQKLLDDARKEQASRNLHHDTIVPIYLNAITPEVDQEFLALDDAGDVKQSQLEMVKLAVKEHRDKSNPLFFVLGDPSWNDNFLNAGDIHLCPETSESVYLAIISSCNETIFNHGLWPTFGALLARSKVTSYAMNKTLLEAAKRASLDWKATIVL